MTHNARVSSRLPTPEIDELPKLWLWLEGALNFGFNAYGRRLIDLALFSFKLLRGCQIIKSLWV